MMKSRALLTKDTFAFPATGDPVTIGLSVPDSSGVYYVEVTYQGRAIRFEYPHDGTSLVATDPLEWLQGFLATDRSGLDEHGKRVLQSLTWRTKRVFGDEFPDFLEIDWSVERWIVDIKRVWERPVPVITQREADRAYFSDGSWMGVAG